MVINGSRLLYKAPIKGMVGAKLKAEGTTYGLGEAGYDIRIKQGIIFTRHSFWQRLLFKPRKIVCLDRSRPLTDQGFYEYGNFVLASAIEEFTMPPDLMGVVHDKSTWARRGLSVFNTVIEPGWKGFLTLELVYHGRGPLHIPAGSGIAQVVFSEVSNLARYEGRYQNQADMPIPAKAAT